MELIRYRPAPPLDLFVDCFWWSVRNEAQNHGEHMLPSGAAQLVFALHETPILCASPATTNASQECHDAVMLTGPVSSPAG